MLFIKIIILILITDFITGFVHFALDQYGSPKSRFFKNAIKINLAHHDDPMLMTKRSYWELTKDSYYIAFVAFPLSLLFVGFHWEILFVLLLGAQTNIIHKWSHDKKQNKPLIVQYLQKFGIIQGKHQHRHHHKKPFDTYFCIITNFWNPIFEKIYFWEGVIKVFKFFGIKPVAGTAVRNNV